MAGKKDSEGDKFAEFINSNAELVGKIIGVVFAVALVWSVLANLL